MITQRFVLPLLCIGALTLGACGGDDASTPAAGTTAPTQTVASTPTQPEPTPTETGPDAVPTPDVPGVSDADTSLIQGYPGWTELTAAPTGGNAQLGSGAHPGDKRVWVSPPRDVLGGSSQTFPYPANTVVVKTVSTGPDVTLLAIMEKVRANDDATGGWRYVEYKRPDGRAQFEKVGFPESGCAGCHMNAKETDWVFFTLE